MGTQTTGPEKQTVAINSILPPWASDYVQNNFIIVAWQVVLVLGGFVLTVHFLHIGFWPDLDLQSSLALLAVVALTGLIVLLFFSLYLVFPCFIWSLFLLDSETGKAITSRLKIPDDKRSMDESLTRQKTHGQFINTEFNQDQSVQKPGTIDSARVFFYFGVPTLSAYLALVLTALSKQRFSFASSMTTAMIWFVLTPLLTGVIIYLFALSKRYSSEHKIKSKGRFWAAIQSVTGRLIATASRLALALVYLLALLVGCVILATSILLLQILMESPLSTLPANNWTFILVVLLAVFANVGALTRLLSRSAEKKRITVYLETLLVGIMLFFVMTLITNTWLLLPEGIVRLYGLGNLKVDMLVLNKEGCALAKEVGQQTEVTEGNDLCRINNVRILNRLGTTYYIESDTGIRYTIPSAMVISYKPTDSKAKDDQRNMQRL